MPGCPECSFAALTVIDDATTGASTWQYDESGFDAAAKTIRDASAQIAGILRTPTADLRARPAPERWSQLEYACHVRDALLVQRERVLKAMRGHGGEPMPMGRDERVVHDAYNEQQPIDVAGQVEQSALLLADLLQRLQPSEWDLEVAYMFPDPSMRTLRWVAVHTAHEVIHHLHDIRTTD